MRSNAILRATFLIFIAVLAADAMWCSEEIVQIPATAGLQTASAPGSSDVAQVDCRACICSGVALLEMTPQWPPLLRCMPVTMSREAHQASQSASIDVPPHEHA